MPERGTKAAKLVGNERQCSVIGELKCGCSRCHLATSTLRHRAFHWVSIATTPFRLCGLTCINVAVLLCILVATIRSLADWPVSLAGFNMRSGSISSVI